MLKKLRILKFTKLKLSVLIPLIAVAFPAHANVAIPTIFVTMPAMLLALLPIIALEVWVVSRVLVQTYISTIKIVTVSNIASTLVGLPLSSLFHWLSYYSIMQLQGSNNSTLIALGNNLSGVAMVLIDGAFLVSDSHKSKWLEVTAISLIIIFSFLFSLVIEYFVYRKLLPEHGSRNLVKATVSSNMVTYSIITISIFSYGYLR